MPDFVKNLLTVLGSLLLILLLAEGLLRFLPVDSRQGLWALLDKPWPAS